MPDSTVPEINTSTRLETSLPLQRPALYLVATPIGNLGDLSPRAAAILRAVDAIAAEDTRVSGVLLRRIGAHAPCFALHAHNEEAASASVLQGLQSGQAIAQMTDAGTPAVSDPGARLVARVHAAGHPVIPIPGPSAALTALCASGFASTQFYFHGFLPATHTARRTEIAALQDRLSAHPCIWILFEAPHRLAECLADLRALLGDGHLALLAREISKRFETIRRAPLAELARWVLAEPTQQRGECVIVLDAPPTPPPLTGQTYAIDPLLRPLLAELPLKQAVSLTCRIGQLPRNPVYARALEIRQEEKKEKEGEPQRNI